MFYTVLFSKDNLSNLQRLIVKFICLYICLWSSNFYFKVEWLSFILNPNSRYVFRLFIYLSSFFNHWFHVNIFSIIFWWWMNIYIYIYIYIYSQIRNKRSFCTRYSWRHLEAWSRWVIICWFNRMTKIRVETCPPFKNYRLRISYSCGDINIQLSTDWLFLFIKLYQNVVFLTLNLTCISFSFLKSF